MDCILSEVGGAGRGVETGRGGGGTCLFSLNCFMHPVALAHQHKPFLKVWIFQGYWHYDGQLLKVCFES